MAYQNAWEKLQKYYNKTDEAHSIYAAAVLLHPSYRKQYFDDKWQTSELQRWKVVMMENVKNTWQNEYDGDTEKPQASPSITDDILDQYLRRATALNSDSFDSFVNGPIVEFNDGTNVYKWVKDNCNSSI